MKTKQDLLFPVVVIMMCLVQSFCIATTYPMKPTGPLTNRTVTIELDVADVLSSLAINKADPVLNKVLHNTLERQKKEDKDFVTLFGESFTQLYPKALLAPIFSSFELRERVSPTSTNVEVLKVLGSEMIKVISQTFIILHIRLESLGLGNANFQKLPLSNRYSITLQNVQDPERLKKMLQSPARIGFWETYKLPDIFPSLADANKKLQELKPPSTNVKKTNLFDLLMLSIDKDNKPINRATIGYAAVKDTSEIIKMLKMEKLSFPRNLAFAWIIKPEKENPLIHALVAIKITTRDGLAPLQGDLIVDAKDTISRSGLVTLEMMMNAEGARIFRRFTSENVGKEIAIMIDGFVYASPIVMDQIPNGRLSITGDFTKEEVHDLATMIKADRLPVAVKVISDVMVAH